MDKLVKKKKEQVLAESQKAQHLEELKK